MFFTHNQTIDFLRNNNLASLGKNLIICPSFENLTIAKQLLTNSTIKLAAQDCSAQQPGPFTGQVSATSLAQIGCHYCIIGHSENRKLCQYSNEQLQQKMEQLFAVGITPIYCFGETLQEQESGRTLEILKEQLKPVIAVIKNDNPIVLAYEPIWAIGTGTAANTDQLRPVYEYLSKTVPSKKATFVYGGSVTAHTVKMLKDIPAINGFLLGKASTNFQELKNIVLSI